MRKQWALVLSVILLFSLTACGEGDTAEDSSLAGGLSSVPEAPASSEIADGGTTATLSSGRTTTSRRGGLTTPSKSSVTMTMTTLQPVKEPLKEDEPMTGNAAILFNEQHSSYDTQAETVRQSILSLKDTVKPAGSGATYYVSDKGSDENDGRTPATAWRSADRVGQAAASFSYGDVVLFERGGVYRGSLALTSGVCYGAYGSGPKPCIYGSPRNYAYASLWEKADKANVWRVKVGTAMGDVGNIVFNHGAVCASGGKKLSNRLQQDFDFYHDRKGGYVYLYLSKGNPGSLYNDIELCPHVFLMRGGRSTRDVEIENLCLKYTGAHAVSFSTDAKNIAIRGCEIGYVGGSMQESRPTVRYGNGIEFVDLAANVTVENNWVYQCYDAGLTHQSGNSAGFYVDNIVFRNNLVEYCVYNIEYFFTTTKGGYRNCLFEGNILRFAGYGFGTTGRIGGSDELVASINGWRAAIPCQNFVIRDNVFDTSYRYLLVTPYADGTKGPTVASNTWIQRKDQHSAMGLMWDGANAAQRVKLGAADAATLKVSVAVIDKTAKTVIFDA